jgi:hypothetical protein
MIVMTAASPAVMMLHKGFTVMVLGSSGLSSKSFLNRGLRQEVFDKTRSHKSKGAGLLSSFLCISSGLLLATFGFASERGHCFITVAMLAGWTQVTPSLMLGRALARRHSK